MKHNNPTSFVIAVIISILFAACAGQDNKIVFRPDTGNNPQEESRIFDSWEIINSQNGQNPEDIPEWVRWYIDNKINEIEALDMFSGKYIFIGENGGSNLRALRQWANGFTIEQDLPRLITRRAERRLVSSASLYPDDEYGEFFEFLIREVSNGEFLGAGKEQTFWLLRKVVINEETDGDIDAQPSPDTVQERFEFFVLISVDKETLQKQIQEIMANIKTKVPPTREQAAAITKIKNTFFEGF
jgi:hypothetical protein